MCKYILLLAGLATAIAAAPADADQKIPSIVYGSGTDVDIAVARGTKRSNDVDFAADDVAAESVAAVMRQGQAAPSGYAPGEVLFCNEPNYRDCHMFNALTYCIRFPTASPSSLLQWQGAYCYWFTVDTCEDSTTRPAYRLDTWSSASAWPSLASQWDGKFKSVSCQLKSKNTTSEYDLTPAKSYEAIGAAGDILFCTVKNFVGCFKQNSLNKCTTWPRLIHSLVQYPGVRCVYYKESSCKGTPWYTLETPGKTSDWEEIPAPYDDWYHAVQCQTLPKTTSKRGEVPQLTGAASPTA